MLIVLDVGNIQIHGGLFDGDRLVDTFRMNTYPNMTSDEIAMFLKSILREWEADVKAIEGVAICSAVPVLLHALKGACFKYFNVEPFIIEPGVKTGLKIRYANPNEVGADRIVNAAWAIKENPNKNLILVDLGTATTFCIINAKQEYLGGLLVPGIKISQAALTKAAAKLPSFEIVKAKKLYGKTTVESLQCGLYHGHVGMINHIVNEIKSSTFADEEVTVIGTGGFSDFIKEDLPFDFADGDITLKGLNFLFHKNIG